MTSTIDAARQTHRQVEGHQTFHRCKACSKVLSIPEFIERHCEACGKDVEVVATRSRS